MGELLLQKEMDPLSFSNRVNTSHFFTRLPLARLYATYFGGSLELMALDGHGTDTFIRLRRLDQDTSIQI